MNVDLGLVAPGESVVVAVSGGSDSTALLHVLVQHGAVVTAAHLDHGMRPTSSDDAQAVVRLCAELHVPLQVERVSVRLRGEAAARQARYAFLRRVAANVGAFKVALAHTADDQAETVLLRLIRGAGAAGLAGMPRRRSLGDGVELVRPLIDAQRADVLAYLRAAGLAWREDETNRDPAYLRNRVRHELLPLLERAYNGSIRAALLRTAALLSEDEAALGHWAERELETRRRGATLRLDGWDGVPIAVQRRVLRGLWAAVTGLPPPTAAHVEALRRGSADLPHGWRGERTGSVLELARPRLPVPSAFTYSLPVPGTVDVPEAGIRVTAAGESDGPLTVRSRRPGDRLRPWGGTGERKLQDVLVDAHVPRTVRDRVAIVTAADGTILWVVGVRRAERLRGAGLRLEAVALS